MSDSTTKATDQQVMITRIFEAPRERVFRSWTDPDEVAAWYGPEHMEAPRDCADYCARVRPELATALHVVSSIDSAA